MGKLAMGMNFTTGSMSLPRHGQVDSRGFTLIEVLVALAIAGLSLSLLFSGVSDSLTREAFSDLANTAISNLYQFDTNSCSKVLNADYGVSTHTIKWSGNCSRQPLRSPLQIYDVEAVAKSSHGRLVGRWQTLSLFDGQTTFQDRRP